MASTLTRRSRPAGTGLGSSISSKVWAMAFIGVRFYRGSPGLRMRSTLARPCFGEETMSMLLRIGVFAVVVSFAWVSAVPADEREGRGRRDLTGLTVVEAAHLIREGQVSSVELTRALLRRIRA